MDSRDTEMLVPLREFTRDDDSIDAASGEHDDEQYSIAIHDDDLAHASTSTTSSTSTSTSTTTTTSSSIGMKSSSGGIDKSGEGIVRGGTPTPTPPRDELDGPERLAFVNDLWKSWLLLALLSLTSVLLSVTITLKLTILFWTVRYSVALTFGLLSVVFLLVAKHESYVFDSTKGKLTVSTRRLFGVTVREFWLYEIKDVRLHEFFDPQGGTDYELYVYLRSGLRIKLFSGHIIGCAWEYKSRVQDEVKSFLERFNRRYRARSKASHSVFRAYLKRQHSVQHNLNSPRALQMQQQHQQQ